MAGGPEGSPGLAVGLVTPDALLLVATSCTQRTNNASNAPTEATPAAGTDGQARVSQHRGIGRPRVPHTCSQGCASVAVMLILSCGSLFSRPAISSLAGAAGEGGPGSKAQASQGLWWWFGGCPAGQPPGRRNTCGPPWTHLAATLKECDVVPQKFGLPKLRPSALCARVRWVFFAGGGRDSFCPRCRKMLYVRCKNTNSGPGRQKNLNKFS